MPAHLSELGDSKVSRDYKISKHHLALQESNSRSYVQRRALFYELTIVKYESRPTRTFLNKDTHIKLRANYKQLKSAEPTAVFIRLFDESFKNYYTNIIQEIERLTAYQTPLHYMHNFTTDIKNLYYYNNDCTSVRAEV